MYTVQIFCATEFLLTEAQKRHLDWKKLIPGGVTNRHFATRETLFRYVREFDYHERKNGVKKLKHNDFLKAVMCNPNDSRRHEQLYNSRIYDACYYLGYLVNDDEGRIIDLRNHVDEIYALDLTAEAKKRRVDWEEEWAIRRLEFMRETWEERNGLYEGEPYWGYYRRIQTMNERRQACNDQYSGLIRVRRKAKTLPTAWDDLYFHREKSWKARNTKARRQYEVNLPKHVDTIKISVDSFSSDDGEDFCMG